MSTAFLDHVSNTLAEIDAEGLTKRERLITSPQGGEITVNGRSVINLCANNYLGLADHPALIAAAKRAMDDHGFGMASVRFICGTQDLHRALEQRLAQFLGLDDAILFAASPTAAKAYERIGFRRRGDYRVALLKPAHILGAAT